MKDNKKEFLRDCARYIQGEVKEVRLRGKKKDCIPFANALKESRNLYERLNEENPSISNVMNALEKKKLASRRLRKVVGFVWPF